MKKAFTAIVIALTAAILGGASSPPNWTTPTKPFRVIDDVYYVGTEGLSAWLITTPRGHILLDVGMPQNAALVEANIVKLGFRLKDVKILLNSHAHFDHSGGMAKLKADTGAKVWASAGDKPALETGVYPGWESRHDFDFPPVKVDRVITDGERISLGGRSLKVMITPGHTSGCTSYLMTVHDHGVRHKAFFFCSATVAANRLAPDPQYPGIVDDYRRTFQRLADIDADVLLAPHAEMFDLAAKRARRGAGLNPFVVPGEARRFVATLREDFERQLAKQQAGK
jgi:metallo-beta-lactamase class B